VVAERKPASYTGCDGVNAVDKDQEDQRADPTRCTMFVSESSMLVNHYYNLQIIFICRVLAPYLNEYLCYNSVWIDRRGQYQVK
jgi:hypothetical protein